MGAAIRAEVIRRQAIPGLRGRARVVIPFPIRFFVVRLAGSLARAGMV
jgi:hypothetical protein